VQKFGSPSGVANGRFGPVVCRYAPTTGYYLTALQAEEVRATSPHSLYLEVVLTSWDCNYFWVNSRSQSHPMNISHHIIITGFMGSGKTTVARALAHILKRELVDLDQVIAEQEGRTAQEIIDQDGEATFRVIETAYPA